MRGVDCRERRIIPEVNQEVIIAEQHSQSHEKKYRDLFFIFGQPREKFFRVETQQTAEQKYKDVMENEIIQSPCDERFQNRIVRERLRKLIKPNAVRRKIIECDLRQKNCCQPCRGKRPNYFYPQRH